MTQNSAALEAILFANGEPVPIDRISLILSISEADVLNAAEELSMELAENGHGISLVRLENKLQLCSMPQYADVIIKVLEQRKPAVLSPASMEALAIVAYYQPVTAAYISKIRGVDSSYTLSSLCDKGLVAKCGVLEAPGRPSLYGTTDLFLRTMQITDINELPPLPEVAASEGIEKLREAISELQEQEKESNLGELT